jgi:hypothetical protein
MENGGLGEAGGQGMRVNSLAELVLEMRMQEGVGRCVTALDPARFA